MFNSKAEFTVKILSGGVRSCKMRFPSDQEWADRVRKQAFIDKDLGRGESVRNTEGSEKADKELFDKIRLDDPRQEFDEFEAGAFLERLEQCEVTSAEQDGEQFRIEILAMRKFPVVHTLKTPSQRDMHDFRVGSFHRRTNLEKGYQKVQMSIEPSAEMWKRLMVSVDGYAADVPIIHKDRAITALWKEVNRLLEDLDPEA